MCDLKPNVGAWRAAVGCDAEMTGGTLKQIWAQLDSCTNAQEGPKSPLAWLQSRTFLASLIRGELLAKGCVFDGEIALGDIRAAAECGDEREEGAHGRPF